MPFKNDCMFARIKTSRAINERWLASLAAINGRNGKSRSWLEQWKSDWEIVRIAEAVCRVNTRMANAFEIQSVCFRSAHSHTSLADTFPAPNEVMEMYHSSNEGKLIILWNSRPSIRYTYNKSVTMTHLCDPNGCDIIVTNNRDQHSRRNHIQK